MTWMETLPRGAYEAVLVLKSPGRINASAVGIEWDGTEMRMVLFQGSNSYDMIGDVGVCGICFFSSDNIYPLLRAALLGYGSGEEEFFPEEYENMGGVPVLSSADYNIVAQVRSVEKSVWRDDIGQTPIKRLVVLPLDQAAPPHLHFTPPRVSENVLLRAAAALTRSMFLCKQCNPQALEMLSEAERILKEQQPGEGSPCFELLRSTMSNVRKELTMFQRM